MSKKTICVLSALVIIAACVVVYVKWNTPKSLGDTAAVLPASSTATIQSSGAIRVWGSEDEKKEYEQRGYLPREMQYGGGVVRVEDISVPNEPGNIKLIHYKDNLIRINGTDEQGEGVGAPMVGYVTVEMKTSSSPWAQCAKGAIGDGVSEESGYDIFLFGNKVVTLTRSHIMSVGRALVVNICEEGSDARTVVLKSSDRDTAIRSDVDAEIKKLYAGDDSFGLWLGSTLSQALDKINANALRK